MACVGTRRNRCWPDYAVSDPEHANDAASSAVELAGGRISTRAFIVGGGGAAIVALLGLAAMRARFHASSRQPTQPGRAVEYPNGVMAGIASANRDPDYFEDPETADLTREPNRHLLFGKGGHYCLGAPLARMEGRIALTALFARAPALRVAGDPAALAWRGGLVLRGLEALPVEIR